MINRFELKHQLLTFANFQPELIDYLPSVGGGNTFVNTLVEANVYWKRLKT